MLLSNHLLKDCHPCFKLLILPLILFSHVQHLILAGGLFPERVNLRFKLRNRAFSPLDLGAPFLVLIFQHSKGLLILQLHGGKLGLELSTFVVEFILNQLIQGLLARRWLHERPLLLLWVESTLLQFLVDPALAEQIEVRSDSGPDVTLVLGNMEVQVLSKGE